MARHTVVATFRCRGRQREIWISIEGSVVLGIGCHNVSEEERVLLTLRGGRCCCQQKYDAFVKQFVASKGQNVPDLYWQRLVDLYGDGD
jgi:hypothetical protein